MGSLDIRTPFAGNFPHSEEEHTNDFDFED